MTELIDRVLAGYPHAAACPACRSYAAEILSRHTAAVALAAILGHHGADHRLDPLTVASAQFAPIAAADSLTS